MPSIELPLNMAHQHVANAEDLLGQGLLVPAVQEHRDAADAYMTAHTNSNDDSAKRTLKLLHNEHTKAANELQRKIDQLKAEGKDPSLPQKLPQVRTPSAHNTIPRSPHSPPLERQLVDTVDESFMILHGQRADPADSFNQFWNVMQQALENHLPQPVAFASLPLGDHASTPSPSVYNTVREGSSSSDTDQDDPIVSRLTKRFQGMGNRFHQSKSGPSSKLVAESRPPDIQDDLFDDGDDLSESFMLIPSGSPKESSALQKENLALRSEVEALRNKLATTDQSSKVQQGQLRDSIYHATREAHRMFNRSQMLGDQNSVNSPPVIGVQSGREAQYVRRVQELDRRVKELEDELRAVRTESDRYKAMNGKFRERWDKLKESARRKKEAKNKAGLATDRIEEDPEAEERLDGAT